MVTGPAGTGKTLFQKELTRSLMAFDRGAKIKCAAYTNAASRLMPAGRTLQHLRLRLARRAPERLVLIIDEVSMVPLSLGTELSRLTRLGTRFYLIGDFDGQELPIFDDGWGMKGMGGTQMAKYLAGNLHIVLSVNRRCSDDPEHFRFYTALYPYADDDPLASVERARERYPYDGVTRPGITVCKSHRKRRQVNAWLNLDDNVNDAVFVKSVGRISGSSSQPQDMHVRPGMTMIGYSAGKNCRIKSGVEYSVRSVRPAIVVDMADPYRTTDEDRSRLDPKKLLEVQKLEDGIELTLEETSRWLRLSYAVCYYSIQGRTIKNRSILLLDTGHMYYTVRNLIVGISRASRGSQVMIPSRECERRFLESLPVVPDEVVIDPVVQVETDDDADDAGDVEMT